jgi:hypothetical protein
MNLDVLIASTVAIITAISGALAVFWRQTGPTSERHQAAETHTEDLIQLLRMQLERCQVALERSRVEVDRLHGEIRDLMRKLP